MGLFSKRKSRATRRAEARAMKRRATLDARYAARNEKRRIKSAERSADKALRAQFKAQRDSDKAALKVAETSLKAAREGKLLSPTRIRRMLTVTRLLAPVLVPITYRVAVGARGWLDERRARSSGCRWARSAGSRHRARGCPGESRRPSSRCDWLPKRTRKTPRPSSSSPR